MQLRELKTELLLAKAGLAEKLDNAQQRNLKLIDENNDLKSKLDKLKVQYDDVMKNMKNSQAQNADNTSQLEQLRAELKSRSEIIERMTDENKQLR